MQTSEDGFLLVGSRLRKIHLSTQNVSERLAGLLNDSSAEGGTSSLSELQRMSERSVKQLNSFNDFWLQAVDQLRRLESPLSSLPESLKQFDRLVSRLRMMGITARIEAARIGEDGLGFVNLAEEVSLLGEQITPKAKEVHKSIERVGEVIAFSVGNLVGVIGEHGEISEGISSDMQSNLNVLDQKRDMGQQTASGISRKSEDALRCVHTVVQSVQYHDITRQQIDHIIEALQSIQRQDSVLEVVPICEIQVAHLKRVGKEFEEAVLSIAAALGDLSNAVTMMVSESERMTNFARDSGNIFLNYVQRGLETVNATMAKDQDAVIEFTSSLGLINENIRKMKSFMDEMADVGSEIELLALNSRVKAAKMGSEGAGLGVIAESIQHLSIDARVQIHEVAAQMSQMVVVSSDLTKAHSIETVTQHAESETQDIIAKLAEAMRAFHLGNSMSIETFRETERVCKTIVGELESLAKEIDGHREVAASLLRTSNMLEELAGELRASVPDSARAIIDERLEEMRLNYTMETERSTHQAVLNGNEIQMEMPSGGSGGVELF